MPEGPELHLTSLFINKTCRDLIFSGKIARNPIHKCAEINWDEPSYSICAESRGKELMLHLQAVDLDLDLDLNESDRPGSRYKDKKNSSSRKQKGPIQCELSKKEKCSTSSILFTFGMSGKFEWTRVDEMLKHSHLTFFTQTKPDIEGQESDTRMALSFVDYRRFGKWHQNAAWSSDRGPCIIQEFDGFVNNIADNLNHNVFKRPICEAMLDQRFFSGIGNYLRAEVLYRCKVAPFERASSVLKSSEEEENTAESNVILTKKPTNGRKKKNKDEIQSPVAVPKSELMDFPRIKSEPSVERIVQIEGNGTELKEHESEGTDRKIAWQDFSPKGQEILHLCHSVALEVVAMGSKKSSLSDMYKEADDGSQSFHDWLQCYGQDGMKNLADHNSRTIWFSGPAGPLVPKEQRQRTKKTRKKTSKNSKSKVISDSNDISQVQTNLIIDNRKSTKITGKLTRKRLENIEKSDTAIKNGKPKGTPGKSKKEIVKAMHDEGTAVKSGSKRRRNVHTAPTESSGVKRTKKASNESKPPRKL